MLLLMVFKLFLKNKWTRRKLKYNRLLHDIRNNFLNRKKRHDFISVTYLVAQKFFRKPALFGNKKEKRNGSSICGESSFQ